MIYSDFKNFGELMIYYRGLKNIKQYELAEKTGLSRVTISHAETGDKITLVNKIKIMRALDVPDEIVQEFKRYN